MDKVIFSINNLIYFIIAFFIIIILLSCFFAIFLKKNQLKKGNLGLYGLFFGLSNKDIWSISILTVKYIFIIWCLTSNNINYVFLICLLIPGIIYNIMNKRLFNLFFDIISSFIMYFALISKMILMNYISEVAIEWYVVVILGFLYIFILLYNTYYFLKDMNFVLKKNEFIEKKENIK